MQISVRLFVKETLERYFSYVHYDSVTLEHYISYKILEALLVILYICGHTHFHTHTHTPTHVELMRSRQPAYVRDRSSDRPSSHLIRSKTSRKSFHCMLTTPTCWLRRPSIQSVNVAAILNIALCLFNVGVQHVDFSLMPTNLNLSGLAQRPIYNVCNLLTTAFVLQALTLFQLTQFAILVFIWTAD